MIYKVKFPILMLAVLALAAWAPVPTAAMDGCGAERGCCAGKGAEMTASATDAPIARLAGPGQGGTKGRHGQGQRDNGGQMGALMGDAHALVFNHTAIEREVEEIPAGVITRTTTSDPELLAVLQRHPEEMAAHLKEGGHVRRWDPLFAELAAVADEVDMEVTNLENGVEVRSTSDNPEVAKLIKAHAYKVSEFVARGRAAMHEGTPLPADYQRVDGVTNSKATEEMPACCQKMTAEASASDAPDPHANH